MLSEGVADHAAKVEEREPGVFGVLWNELKPYPGRDLAALRMAIACTAIVLISNTFKLPLQDVLPFLVLFTAKEEKITTTITAVLALFAIISRSKAESYCLKSIRLIFSYRWTGHKHRWLR